MNIIKILLITTILLTGSSSCANENIRTIQDPTLLKKYAVVYSQGGGFGGFVDYTFNKLGRYIEVDIEKVNNKNPQDVALIKDNAYLFEDGIYELELNCMVRSEKLLVEYGYDKASGHETVTVDLITGKQYILKAIRDTKHSKWGKSVICVPIIQEIENT